MKGLYIHWFSSSHRFIVSSLHRFFVSSSHRLIVSSCHRLIVDVHNFARFVNIFPVGKSVGVGGFVIFALCMACCPRLYTTDCRINIYVLNFIQYETVITINQTVPRSAEHCRPLPRILPMRGRTLGADDYNRRGRIVKWVILNRPYYLDLRRWQCSHNAIKRK